MSEICQFVFCQCTYLFGPLEPNKQIYTVHDRQVKYNFNIQIQIYKWYTIYSQNMLLSLQ